jgi:hypothetical protein
MLAIRTLLIDGMFRGHQVGQANPPMGADLTEGSLPLLKSIDEEGLDYTMQLCG